MSFGIAQKSPLDSHDMILMVAYQAMRITGELAMRESESRRVARSTNRYLPCLTLFMH